MTAKKILFMAIISASIGATAHASSLPEEYVKLVENEVVREYSHVSDGDDVSMSLDEIWGLELAENSPDCLAVVSGLAKKPYAHGSTTNQFFVCINKDSAGNLFAHMIDDVEVADE